MSTTTTPDLALVSFDELAAGWGVHRDTVRAIVAREAIPTVRIGRLMRVRRSDAAAYLDRISQA